MSQRILEEAELLLVEQSVAGMLRTLWADLASSANQGPPYPLSYAVLLPRRNVILSLEARRVPS